MVNDGGVVSAKGYSPANVDTGQIVVVDETWFHPGSVPKLFGGVVSSLYPLSVAIESAWITSLSLKMLRFDSLAWAFLIVADVHS